MRKLIGFATLALVLYMLAGCSAEVRHERAAPVETASTGEPAVPVTPAPYTFTAYATGVKGVHVLVDRDTGCQFIATSVNWGGSGGSAGYTSITPRTWTSSQSQKCPR